MKIKIRDIPTFYKILFPSIAITLMVTLTSTIFTYNKASEIILKKTVRQSQETVRQMSENYENFMQGIYDKINYIAYSATTQEELCYGEKGAYEEGYFSRERELNVRWYGCLTVFMWTICKSMRKMEKIIIFR